ncbi:hypothetical protein C2845_PM02G18140 [Panicum miliaceum]|uniref:Flavin-containing monooxygenase n=1 Tax=Panicum miliaceum TaxID=4540 RepID=A0A3L6SGE7_PANMI|nr:hypothetical protein C2845_PM02G18140 [Panicum miliaceum]
MVEKKRVVIVGAGVSGLAACKHLLERGCRPTVFEADTVLGGVWARAPACTELQTPRPLYQYSDFPWPESVTQVFPYHRQVVTYLDAYARHFGVLDCIRFGHRVVGMEYDGVSEEAVAGWKEWAGNGEAFGSGAGEWRLSVANAEGHVETHKADFVILCIGRFSGVPNVPTFPEGKGPEAFDGHVIHSMDYAKLGTSKAKEMIRGKRVTVVGYLKSALDIPAECAEVRWAFSKFAESYYSIPMKKFDMVPDHSLFEVLAACLIAITPKDHYNRLEEGSIVLKKSKTFTFCKEGLLVEGESSPLKSDIVIFGTGFQGDEKIKDMFTSEYSRTIAVGSASTTVPLYRECIHPKIPQLAVIGYSESISNLYTSELRAKWLVHFMNGGFRLPNVTVLQKDVLEWEKYMKSNDLAPQALERRPKPVYGLRVQVLHHCGSVRLVYRLSMRLSTALLKIKLGWPNARQDARSRDLQKFDRARKMVLKLYVRSRHVVVRRQD